MPRKVRDKDLGDRTARERLEIRGRLHKRSIERGLIIGYRRLRGKSGSWTAIHYLGKGKGYAWDLIGTADDRSDADGITVFSFDQAVDKARKLHTDRANIAAGICGPMTVDEAMVGYVTKLDHDGKNVRNIELTIRRYISPMLGTEIVGELTSDKLNDWKAKIAKMPARGRRVHNERARRATANITLATLKAGLNVAYEAGKVESNKAWRSVKAFKGVTRAREGALSVADAQRLMNAAGSEFRPMIQAGLETGCRYAELCHLKVSDFDPDNKTLLIQKTKTHRSRYVHLTDEGVRFFKTLAAGHRRSEPLIRRDDGLPFSTSQQIRRMKVACENARLDPISFHILRHSYASALVNNGVPLAYVAKSLGHTSIKMVEQHYGHIEESHFKKTIRASVPEYGFAKSNITTIKR